MMAKTEYLHHNNVDSLVYLDTSAEQAALYMQAFELARLRITQAIKTGRLPADRERFCVFSDLDETLFDNSRFNAWLVVAGREFEERCNWKDWCNEHSAELTPGAKEFVAWLQEQKDARNNPIELIFVTSRIQQDVRAGTIQNLKQHQLPVIDGDLNTTNLFMKGLDVGQALANAGISLAPEEKPDRKYAQYKFVEHVRKLQPILWLGDNGSDFDWMLDSRPQHERLKFAKEHATDWGSRWIQFPNPVYGSFLLGLKDPVDWDTPLQDGTGSSPMPRTGETTPKIRALKVWR